MAEIKKISKVYIQYPDGSGEHALIYLPIEQVDSLAQSVSWNELETEENKEES